MSDSITRNWQKEVLLGYVCPECGSVVKLASILSMRLFAGSSLFSDTRERVKLASDFVLDTALKDIRGCGESHMRMGGERTLTSPEHKHVDMKYQFTCIEAPCPFCGHVEEWQKAGGAWEAGSEDGSEKRNLPVVFDTEEDCRNWLAENVHRIKAERMAYWKNNPGIKANIAEQIELLNTASAELKEKVEAIQTADAEAKKAFGEKENEADKLPLFSAKKKELREQLYAEEKALNEQIQKHMQEIEELKNTQETYRQGLHKLECQKLGFTGEIKEYTNRNSAAYRPE